MTKPPPPPPSLADITKAVDKTVAARIKAQSAALDKITALHTKQIASVSSKADLLAQRVDRLVVVEEVVESNVRALFKDSDQKHNQLLECFQDLDT
jgi:uncharacterized coiled-coil DUF342 family protein